MFKDVLDICRTYPQIIVFLTLAIGYALGKVKIFGISFGATTCVLLTALVLGQVGIQVPALLKAISFALFIFCIGYKVGPQFFGALRKEGIKYMVLSVVVALTGLATAIILAKIFHFDKGTAAGFFAGSVTQSAAIGTAEGAISHLSISAAQKSALDTNVAVAYAITYIFGTAGGILFFKIAPRILGINLRDEAEKLQQKMSGAGADSDKPGLFSWSNQLQLRAYRAVDEKVINKSVHQLEELFPGRVAVDKIKRAGEIIELSPDTVIKADDILVIAGRPELIISAGKIIGPEVDVTKTTNVVGEMIELCVLNSNFVGKTLGQISENYQTHGVFLRQITRQGHKLPITRDTVVNKCDILQIIGAKDDVERIVKLAGYPERPTAVTDLIMVGIGCVLGTLIGLIAVPLGGIPITLGIGGGVLVMGLLFGWLRSLHPTFGQIPEGGQWILMNLGLNLFIACVGLGAGPKALAAFQTTGLVVFLTGAVLCLMPFVVGLIFGKFVLKLNPVLLLGALAGSRVITAALNTLQEDAHSSVPVLGYAAPYAFGNVLLTIWGSVIINVV